MTDSIDILSVLSDDKTTVAYRPALARILDSALAAVLLQQIIYWWKQKDRLPFFKFKQPCKHKAYHGGDSWCEELALSRSEFDNALGVIGTKIKRGMTRESALAYKMPEEKDFIGFESGFKSALKIAFKHLILYWTDGNRITWYMINEVILKQILALAYGPKAESSFTYVKQNPALPYKAESSFTYLTENTQRLHKEENIMPDADAPAIEKSDATLNAQLEQARKEQEAQASKPALAVVDRQVQALPKGTEARYVSRQLDQESWTHVEHLVGANVKAPDPVCKRCKEKLSGGIITQTPAPLSGTTYTRCVAVSKNPKAPAINKPLLDAVAEHIEKIDPAMANGYTGKLAGRAGDVWKRKLGLTSLTAENYASIARSIPRFVEWFAKECPGCNIRDADKFESRYTQFVGSNGIAPPKPVPRRPGEVDPADWVSVPHPDPDKAALGITKSVHKSDVKHG